MRLRRSGMILLSAIVAALLFGGAARIAATEFFLGKAERNLQNLLLSQRGLHLYMQQVMHPTLYERQDNGQIPPEFYSPEAFSSSFIVRKQHAYYNELRREAALPEIYYKMAALNPRNPVNRADPSEADLIRLFNERRDLTSHRETVERDGHEYLVYAVPFLENTRACLRCHGDPADAPRQLRARYPGAGGFNERLGEVRAIESVRVPVENENRAALATSVGLLAGFLAFGGLGFANRWLRRSVRERTAELEIQSLERRRAEELLNFTQAAVDRMSDAIFWIREDGSLLYVNEAACQSLGYSREELLALTIFEVDPHIDPGRWAAAWERARLSESLSVESRHRRRDGQQVPVDVAATFTHRGGEPCLWVVARDISARKRLEAQLLQSQKMEALGTLAGGIAHDFNNLLAAMIGYAELVQSELPADAESREDVEEILVAGRRARDLVERILAFSRRDQRSVRPLQVGLLVEETLKLLRATVPATIEFRTAIDPSLWALADSTGLHQVVMNLCTNAYQAMRPRGGLLEVELAAVEVTDGSALSIAPGSWVRLRVRDDGPGIDPETRARLFEPYFTTKPLTEGTGLGLPIAHGIVTGYGGAILVDSEPGKGSTFDVLLPRADPAGDGADSGHGPDRDAPA